MRQAAHREINRVSTVRVGIRDKILGYGKHVTGSLFNHSWAIPLAGNVVVFATIMYQYVVTA